MFPGTALACATSDRGACHLRTTFYKPELAGISPPDRLDGKAVVFVDYEDRLNLFDALILCRFYRDLYGWDELAEIVRLATGTDPGRGGLEVAARRIADDARRFNLEAVLRPEDEDLPGRFYHEPLPETGAVVSREAFQRLLREYHALRGWSEPGRGPAAP